MIFSPPNILVFTADARFVGGSHPSCTFLYEKCANICWNIMPFTSSIVAGGSTKWWQIFRRETITLLKYLIEFRLTADRNVVWSAHLYWPHCSDTYRSWWLKRKEICRRVAVIPERKTDDVTVTSQAAFHDAVFGNETIVLTAPAKTQKNKLFVLMTTLQLSLKHLSHLTVSLMFNRIKPGFHYPS